jgi:hypothetical protein
MTYRLTTVIFQVITLCFGISLSSATISAPLPVATYNFENSLTANETGSPALIAIDPLSQNGFLSDSVFGETRQVYRFDGNTTSSENAGLYISTLNVFDNNDAYSVEMIFQFEENQSTWENIFGVSNRQSDRAFYVQPNNSLQVWPDESGSEVFTFGNYHHVTLTNDGTGHVTVYLDGVFQFDSQTVSVDFSDYSEVNPERIIHFFADNVAAGGQNEFSDGRIALIRLYDIELSSQDVRELGDNPFISGNPSGEDSNDCVATYNPEGFLNIPCVTVPDAFGGVIMYQADMKLIPLSNPFSFELTGAQQKGEPITNNNCTATYKIDGSLNIPCVAVSDVFGGSTMYQADMQLIPTSNPLTFNLASAQKK